jgi:ParB family transcriptional regulator, chromosome partitioning protein
MSKKTIRYKTPSSGMTAMAAPNPSSNIRSSIGLEGVAGDLYSIRVENLIPFNNQARKIFVQEDIDALAETIKKHGIRQPLTVIKCPDIEFKYQVVSGERRLKAALQIGLTKVPCIVLQDASKANEIALIENLHRTDLHPIENAEAYSKLLTLGVFATQQELADKLSIKKSVVSETLKLDSIPASIKTFILAQGIKSRDTFRRLLAMDSETEMRIYLKMDEAPRKSIESPSMKSISILRITLAEGEYKIQKKAMNVLTSAQKQHLKEKLEEIINQLG